MPQRGRTGRTPLTAGLSRLGVCAGGLALFSLATACGGGGEDTSEGNGKSSKSPAAAAASSAPGVVAPAKIEVIAGLAGCEAEIRVEADELREGVCHSDRADYRITTFPAEKYKEAWLDAARIYGGKYLVGPQWVVSAEPEHLASVQRKLGGTVRQLQGTS